MTNAFSQKKDIVNIHVKLDQAGFELKPIWAWFGYDEPNYTYMKDGKKLLSEIAALSPVPVYVRAHSLLVTGDGTAALKWGSTNAYTEDANGNPVYDWKIVDSIFDTYIKTGHETAGTNWFYAGRPFFSSRTLSSSLGSKR